MCQYCVSVYYVLVQASQIDTICDSAASEPAVDGNGVIEISLHSNLTLQYSESQPSGVRIMSSLAKHLATATIEVCQHLLCIYVCTCVFERMRNHMRAFLFKSSVVCKNACVYEL